MEHFNKEGHDKVIVDFTEIISRYQKTLKECLRDLELELTNEFWLDFTSNGCKKIKETCYEKIKENVSIYNATPNKAPINQILTKIADCRNFLTESITRPRTQAYLIPLNSITIDGVISKEALGNLKNHFTTHIEEKKYKAMQDFIKSHKALNDLMPQQIKIEAYFLTQNHNGELDINFYNL